MNVNIQNHSISPLHDNTIAELQHNDLLAQWIVFYISHFKNEYIFSRNFMTILDKIAKYRFSEYALTNLINAFTSLGLGVARNLELSLIRFIELHDDFNTYQSEAFKNALMAFKEFIKEKSLINIIKSLLLNPKLLNCANNEIEQLRVCMLTIMNQQDLKLLPSLSVLTMHFRQALHQPILDSETIMNLKRELEFIIKILGMNPHHYRSHHHELIIESSRVNIPWSSNAVNQRLSTFVEQLKALPEQGEINLAVSKLNSMYGRILELLVRLYIMLLNDKAEIDIILTMINGEEKPEKRVTDALHHAGLSSRFSYANILSPPSPLQTLLKCVNPSMLTHIDSFSKHQIVQALRDRSDFLCSRSVEKPIRNIIL